MSTSHVGTQVQDILQQESARTGPESWLLIVNPSPRIIETAVGMYSAEERGATRIDLLAPEDTIEEAMADFTVASRAADRVAVKQMAFRTADRLSANPLVLTAETVLALVVDGDLAAGLMATDEEFVAAALDTYRHRWDTADPFEFRTPPLSWVTERLASDIGADVRAEFTALLEILDSVGGDGDRLDEVALALLVAGKHGVLFYDISTWSEDIGLASKATFSRTKNRLEDAGVLETEPVPIDVGRPRQRLRLGERQLQRAEPDEFVTLVREMLE